MQIKSFMRPLKDAEWLRESELTYALDGTCTVAGLDEDALARCPDRIYVKDSRGYIVGEVMRSLLLFLLRSEKMPIPLQILDSIRDGIVIVDADGMIFYANSAYSSILSVPLRKVLGKNIKTLEPKSLLVKALCERTEQTSERQLIASVGKYVSLLASPLWDGAVFLGAVSVFQDVTELHMLADEVRHMTGVVDEYSQRLREHDISVEMGLVSRSKKFQQTLRQAAMVAHTDVHVLICGELGTGKDMLAHYLHNCSGRHAKPFLTVSCSTVPTEILDEELFGNGTAAGKAMLACGGTLFLDEIDDMPLQFQSRILQLLHQNEKNNIRFIFSCTQPPETLVRDKRLRADLFFLISTIVLTMPPLRERQDDIIPLANQFLFQFNEKYKKDVRLSPSVYEQLRTHTWSGNVRELENYLERIVILGDGTHPLPIISPAQSDGGIVPESTSTLSEQVRDFETRAILAALAHCKGNRSLAMKELGLSRRTFYRKCAELQISGKK